MEKSFTSISLRFPIQGHSHLECDRHMALIKQNMDVDLPHQWHQVFSEARVKPSPFHVIPCTQTMFLTYTDHLKAAYWATCPPENLPHSVTFY
ncbi:hypothetical protein PoB_005913900 [Plakobranchus ocellatus]|uniref:Uncharacterized protein n=1 Tax=Plakobranchus ocellatus TaxID=259542 RepID=A0AAV4CMK5_9GAST|nr:hypothetical protein PoB_005913900 [Plakobranchus ocellatus]